MKIRKKSVTGGMMSAYRIIFFLCFFCAVSLVQPGQTISAQNLIFRVEYTKPIAKVQSLQVIFFVSVSSLKAEEILRDAMTLAIKNLPPSVEILGNAWDSNENQISLSNGKKNIVYNPKTKQYSYL
jgi:hypothetical protein